MMMISSAVPVYGPIGSPMTLSLPPGAYAIGFYIASNNQWWLAYRHEDGAQSRPWEEQRFYNVYSNTPVDTDLWSPMEIGFNVMNDMGIFSFREVRR